MNIEELLDRQPVSIDLDAISNSIKNKKILITGAAGSIGSELTKQVAKFNPQSIIFFDHNENNQFFIEKEIKSLYPNLNIIPRLGSIADLSRASTIFEETKPNIVFHCAANKHVPLSEKNPSEAIHNNLFGTKVIADLSFKNNCETFTLISTDKAVNPNNVYGATKRLAEIYVQLMAKVCQETKFLTVRFGNVLGSAGSVVPIFKSQIEAGGPLTVTHPDMYRYFMTIPEASQLLLQACAFGKNGDIFVLDMGKPVKIFDLAKNMIKLCQAKDIEIKFSGIRPGEKITEELSFDFEKLEPTSHPKIRNAKTVIPSDDLLLKINRLINLPTNTSHEVLKKELSNLIPEATL